MVLDYEFDTTQAYFADSYCIAEFLAEHRASAFRPSFVGSASSPLSFARL